MLLYYLPDGDRNITIEALRETPIGYAFEQRPVICGVHGGPDGQDGIILADSSDASKVGYYPDRQQWAKIPSPQSPAPSPSCWVGKDTGPVAPESLARREQLDGHWTTLADGQQWLCPIARAFAADNGPGRWVRCLPSAVGLDEQGHWTLDAVVDRYANLWTIAERWFEAWANSARRDAGEGSEEPSTDQDTVFDFQGGLDATLACLTANYRLGKAEACLLGLFDDLTPRVVLNALIDAPTFIEWFQKKSVRDAAGSPTDVGPSAETPPTDPP